MMSNILGGVNNIVQYCESDGKKYVLRIYNNGRNSVRVNWEHEVLTRLNAVGPFSFKIPTTIPSLDKNTVYVPLSNGAEACLFELIPGKLPKLTCVRDIGRASGELVTKLEKVEMPSNLKSPNAPYYDIYKVHHATTAANFREYTKSSIFDDIRVWIELLVKEINEIEAKCNSKEYLSLPKQLIHGDLHYDNVLCDNGKVSGLLDFEFSAIDWRAMELAICLSKYAAEKEALSYFEEFVDGFVEHGKLTRKEVEAIPDLINLRVLSNVVYFVGRAIAEEDNISSLLTRAETYSKRVTWIKDNKDNIINLIDKKIKNSPSFASQAY